MRSMAASRAAYMASVKLVSSTFWPCLLHGDAHRAAGGVDEAGACGQARAGAQPGAWRRAKSRPERSETKTGSGRESVRRRPGAPRCPTRDDVDVVAVDLPLDVDADHAVAAGLRALLVDAARWRAAKERA